jgi:hypothetical protein
MSWIWQSPGMQVRMVLKYSGASSFIIRWVPEQVSEADFNFTRLQVSYVNMTVFERERLVNAVDGQLLVGCKNFFLRAFGAYRQSRIRRVRYAFEYYAVTTYMRSLRHLTVLAHNSPVTYAGMEKHVLY